MTGNDLIWLAPWVVFGICLAAMCARLLSARRSARQPPLAWAEQDGSRFHRISTRWRHHLHARRPP